MQFIIACKSCKTQLRGKQTHFCSKQCKNKFHQCYQAQKQRGIDRKIKIVQMQGGQCSVCGYKKNLSALTFHHTNPNAKEFKLDTRSLSNRKLSRILKELDKCVLMCQNCHSEWHNPEHNVVL